MAAFYTGQRPRKEKFKTLFYRRVLSFEKDKKEATIMKKIVNYDRLFLGAFCIYLFVRLHFDGVFFHLIFILLLPSVISQIIEMYKHLKESKEPILSGFRKARITEAVTQVSNPSHLFENLFQDLDIWFSNS